MEVLFKELKNGKIGNPSTSLRAGRKDLMNKVRPLKVKINSEIDKIENELPRGNIKNIRNFREFNLRFRYLKLREMIAAAKIAPENFDHDINSKNFPDLQEKKLLNQVVSFKAKIFSFEKDIFSSEVVAELKKAGFRPATLKELLALAQIDPELQKYVDVLALGSYWERDPGYRTVPVIGNQRGDWKKRRLDLYWDGVLWSEGTLFLAILE
jgi:hypothetical protein